MVASKGWIRRGLAVGIATALALGAPAASAATPEEEAEALITRGVELREQHKDDEALALFKEALAKSPTPRARAQVALAEQALGLWVLAEADLANALSVSTDPWIAKNKAALEGALAIVRRHLGSLDVRGQEGAELVLDGVPLGVLPLREPLRVEAGRRVLEIRAKGYYSTTRTLEVPAGGIARETVTLVVAPPDADPSGRPGDRMIVSDPDPGRTQRLLGWTFAGTGLALGVTGTVAILVRKGIVDDYNELCPGLGAAQPASCEDKIDSARTWMTVSIITYVAGGIFLTGGAVLVATAPKAQSAPAPAAAFGCAPSLGGLACAGRF
ncbi:MAG: hypothetical protein JST00_15710 [Deltaproteobacteria bacterium]|nr:hypothetical protein [Deltaproteobacteria bacterium]